MDTKEQYNGEKRWITKVMLMNIYHITCKKEDRHWRIKDTADYFGVSLGLVSENLKLAAQFDRVKKCSNREEALRKIR